ncbi:hypothetical protein B7R54_09200 [Subtercola boreus]|uniref:Uncharacterized protein n=1 Tax=Subtercola boreus TaxID=120213 RepID=A0A3E0VJ32_9MICO|nr:Trp biosynthesis-associated membrane protein [Subtercola boreus]RFA09390.1 hypothetical protein B7R54_09200 [Subtercola boreus]TQL53573.1 putative membrane protein (TIGR02234 family) [Subtercola boreus]
MTGGTGATGTPGAAEPVLSETELRASRARRLKSYTILAVIVWSGLVFLAWSQPWFSLHAQGRAGDIVTVTVQGAVAAPALSALALAGLALSAALAIAGPVIRIVLGALEFALGLSITVSSVSALADPVQAGQSAITTATGVAGTSSIGQIATASGTELWPFLAIASGALMALTGILIIVSVRRWPASGRKYQPVTFAASDGRTSGNPADLLVDEPAPKAPARDVNTTRTAAVDNWDSLTRGQDPTD